MFVDRSRHDDFKIRSNNRVRPIARPHHTFDSTKYIGGEVDIVIKTTEEVDEKYYSEEDDTCYTRRYRAELEMWRNKPKY